MAKRAIIITAVLVFLLGTIWGVWHRAIKRVLKGHPPVSTGLFQDPEGLSIDPDGNIYVSDEDRGTMTVLSPDGKVLLSFNEIDGKRLIHGDSLVAVRRDHVITIGDHEIWILDLSGDKPKIKSTFTPPDGFKDPEGIAQDANADLYITDEEAKRIQVFDGAGRFIRHIPVDDEPESVCILPGDRILVTFSKNDYCRVYSKKGEPGMRIDGFDNPDYAIVGPGGKIFITDQKNNRVQVFDKDLKPIASIGTSGSGPGEFNSPDDLAFDAAGNLYVADGGNHRIQVLKPTGEFIRDLK